MQSGRCLQSLPIPFVECTANAIANDPTATGCQGSKGILHRPVYRKQSPLLRNEVCLQRDSRSLPHKHEPSTMIRDDRRLSATPMVMCGNGENESITASFCISTMYKTTTRKAGICVLSALKPGTPRTHSMKSERRTPHLANTQRERQRGAVWSTASTTATANRASNRGAMIVDVGVRTFDLNDFQCGESLGQKQQTR